MARTILYIGNRNPSVTDTLKDSTGAAINLTGYTGVQFAFRRHYATANVFKSAAVVVSALTATVRYDFSATDLVNLVPGVYWGQWAATDASGKVETFSAGDYEVRKAA